MDSVCRRIAAPWRQATECSTWNIPEPEPHAIVPRGTIWNREAGAIVPRGTILRHVSRCGRRMGRNLPLTTGRVLALPLPACGVGSQSREGGKAGQGATGDRLCWLSGRSCCAMSAHLEKANRKSGIGRAEPEERNCSTWNNSAPCHSQKCSTWNNCVPRWFQNRPREEAELRGIQRWKRAAFPDRTTMELLAVRPETDFRRAAALR